MQRCVNVIGVGMSPFSPVALNPGLDALIGTTVLQALGDAGVSASALDRVLVASDPIEGATLQRALQRAGLARVALQHCAQDAVEGSILIARARQAILLGQAECVLVLGVQAALAAPASVTTLAPLGVTACEYMRRYQARRETFAMIAVKARQHAALNPLSAFSQVLSLDQVLQAGMIAEPLTHPQFAWPSVGVAAVLLCSGEFARRHCPGPKVRMLAQACVSPLQVSGQEPGSTFGVDYDLNVAAARELYEQAGRGAQEVGVCELHDSSTLGELLLYEALGLCPEGDAEKLVEDGDNTYGGNLVVNPSGGLLSLGQAVAASPLAQCIELVHQLRGSAARRQVVDAQLALQHQTGTDGTVIATLYQRD
ncbi:thiolase C-terminal domain-containing protein [Pseudomonas sp. BJa5]|uniref:thiolase C-terminal domain-containing protein n=1 Tax=Pseudomonas sp. BJa5 TaxID=2936270 RepID=UPI0025599526|nr:lipid-transfer protein [Pseudomonas sp. BGr12]MDL2422182.1 lipid-transfer protein [Pseudomonas sp. BGr12]